MVAGVFLASTAAAAVSENPKLAPIVDVPGLPRVLLIGDSISIGYTLPVRAELAGRANVHRIPVNGGSTSLGLEQLESWLGTGRWDVIHFNFGLHDAKLPPEGKRHVPPAGYEWNLGVIVRRLKATGAKLVWGTITPVPLGGHLAPNRRFGSIEQCNAIARSVMQANGVVINDLDAVVAPHLNEVGLPKDVHFSAEGYKLLGRQVAAVIGPMLPPPTKMTRR